VSPFSFIGAFAATGDVLPVELVQKLPAADGAEHVLRAEDAHDQFTLSSISSISVIRDRYSSGLSPATKPFSSAQYGQPGKQK
jgi:hypothetical protein